MFKLWDKESNLFLPDGSELTPEEVMNTPTWGFTKVAPVVLEQQGGITVAIDNLAILNQIYNIPDGLTDEENIQAITEAANAARNPTPDPSLSEVIDALLGVSE